MSMKKIFIYFIVFLYSALSYGQEKVLRIEDLGKYGVSAEKLDSIYVNGVPGSVTVPLFSEAYYNTFVEKARQNLISGMKKYLSQNGLTWECSFKIWHRMYFGADGTIELFVYHILSPFSGDEEKTFKKLVAEYIQHRKLVEATNKYSICSRIVF